ncbi:hypothetical protein LIA77_11163 [Sarocladium implicatum]|nr:hypothetical protein LIA77_11163 [Sarocladium implicatum]
MSIELHRLEHEQPAVQCIHSLRLQSKTAISVPAWAIHLCQASAPPTFSWPRLTHAAICIRIMSAATRSQAHHYGKGRTMQLSLLRINDPRGRQALGILACEESCLAMITQDVDTPR